MGRVESTTKVTCPSTPIVPDLITSKVDDSSVLSNILSWFASYLKPVV